ncbi:hypothetical protein ONS95_000783 [Cadophora gregata]|uniref:uncharacterized protein n=1 Tax=Cadophora gregata TaxID=51156 RepID=UPI0026DD3E37|nr:uncharacterized protein ONS95_000783 [Cadophora gregata]KAK0103035.1 hypothetical protein ONS96_005647 [Cadophora gregata f. sp. sojae]KAK0128834.1 hypothetical protein ONS95_000783 [Cadophora gregata]
MDLHADTRKYADGERKVLLDRYISKWDAQDHNPSQHTTVLYANLSYRNLTKSSNYPKHVSLQVHERHISNASELLTSSHLAKMKTSSSTILLTLTSFLATTLALPSPASSPYPTSKPSWRVSNYTEGCSPGGCIYNFDIESPSTPSSLKEPTFRTHCTGTNVAGTMQACRNPSITANSLPGPGKFTLVIQHSWTDKEAVTYFVGGNRTVEIGGYPKGFLVEQTSVSAIA